MLASTWKTSLFAVVTLIVSVPVFAQGLVTHLATGNPPTRVGVISVGNSPLGIVITPDGTRAYVVDGGPPFSVSVIGTNPSDPNTYDKVIATIYSDYFGIIQSIAMRSDGKRAYIGDQCYGILSILDTDPLSPTYHQVVGWVDVGYGAAGVAIAGSVTDGNSRAYVANNFTGSVLAVDVQPGSPTENTVLATIQVDGAPQSVATANTVNGIFVYVTQPTFVSVVAIRDSDFSVVSSIDTDGRPVDCAASPDGKTVYVTNADSQTVTVIDTASNTPTGSIAIGDPESFDGLNSSGVAFSPVAKTAYVVNSGGAYNGYHGTVSDIDTAAQMQLSEVDAGLLANKVAFTPDGASAYVTNSLADVLAVCSPP